MSDEEILEPHTQWGTSRVPPWRYTYTYRHDLQGWQIDWACTCKDCGGERIYSNEVFPTWEAASAVAFMKPGQERREKLTWRATP